MTYSRFSTVALALLAGISAFACGGSEAEAHHPRPHTTAPSGQIVSVSVETPSGASLNSYWYEGAMYVAGSEGQRYNIRLTNHTHQRVEAVVTVDGRDVVSGELGDYRSQRGYVLDPYASVTIEGYRRTLDHVAAFRFSDVPDSYSARRGTPQHVGVIGVAVFREQVRRRRTQTRPVRPAPEPYPRRHYYEPYADAEQSRGSGGRSKRRSAPPASEPSAGAMDMDGAAEAEAAPRSRGDRSSRSGGYARREFAPPPHANELGTEYGETRYSSVQEVTFRRRNRRRPDAMVTLYYDSMRGLRARGIPVDPPPPYDYYGDPEPDPWPYSSRFAPPPPRRY